MKQLRILVFALILCVLGGLGVFARTYTDEDVKAMKRTYERRNRPTLSSARFPTEVLREPWRDPKIVSRFLPYQEWEDEYRQYFLRHTGEPSITLEPRVLVMHYTVCATFETAWNVFYRGANMDAGDKGSVFGHPSVHFMIDRDGTVYQLLPLDRRATGAYGVNHVALQIEMVAVDEADLLNNSALMKASFRLARMLTSRFRIPHAKVYGHYEVSTGKSVVPEYLDKADSAWPTSYPPSSARTDPGTPYMSWLRYYLRNAR